METDGSRRNCLEVVSYHYSYVWCYTRMHNTVTVNYILILVQSSKFYTLVTQQQLLDQLSAVVGWRSMTLCVIATSLIIMCSIMNLSLATLTVALQGSIL